MTIGKIFALIEVEEAVDLDLDKDVVVASIGDHMVEASRVSKIVWYSQSVALNLSTVRHD